MIIENRKIYKSDDGKEFTTEEACLSYEKKLAEKRKTEHERKLKVEKRNKEYEAIVDSIKKFNKEYNTSHRLWVDVTPATDTATDTATATELFDLLFK